MIRLTKEGSENLRRRLNNPTIEEKEAEDKFFKEFGEKEINFEEKLKIMFYKIIEK